MALWRSGAKVLSWNVFGDVFLSQTSMLKTGVLKLGMRDLFHAERVDPKTKNDGRHERTNARASFAHDGDKHVDERKHRTGVFHSPEPQFCQALRGNNSMTAGQKQLESEQNGLQGSWSGPDFFVGPDGCGCVDGYDGFDGFGGSDGLDGFDGT